MNEYLTALGLALIPAAGNFFGGLLAEVIPISKRGLSLALHAAAGIVTAVVAVDIMPRAKDIKPSWAMIGAGATIGSTLALLLALGQVGADIPEGFATMAVLRREGLKKLKRIFLSAAFALPVLLGATLGF